MTTTSFRDLTTDEKTLLLHLLAQDFLGRDQLLQQIQTCKVRTIDDDGSLEFHIDSPMKASLVKSRVPTEGEVEDSDGVTIHFLLHVIDAVTRELEVFKEDGSPVVTQPIIERVRVFAPE